MNAESARYKELPDRYYLPADWMQYGEIGQNLYKELEDTTRRQNELYHKAVSQLIYMGMEKAMAKESARYFKTYNTQLNTVLSLNFDGLIQLHEKRGLASPSQREIARVVEDMVQAVRDIPGNPFKHSLEAFGL